MKAVASASDLTAGLEGWNIILEAVSTVHPRGRGRRGQRGQGVSYPHADNAERMCIFIGDEAFAAGKAALLRYPG